MKKNVIEARDRANSASAKGAFAIDSPIGVSESGVVEKYNSLVLDNERENFLKAGLQNLQFKAKGWSDLYGMLHLLEQSPGIVSEAGYDSFEGLLKDKLGHGMREFKEMESIYQYAAVACPELIHMEWEAARALARFRAIEAAGRQGRPKKAVQLVTEKEKAEARLDYAKNYKEHSKGSFERLIARVKRDKPEIIEKIENELATGEYNKYVYETQTGQIGFRNSVIEEDAGLNSGAQRSAKRHGLDAKTLRGRIQRAVKGVRTKAHRKAVVQALMDTSWFEDALREYEEGRQ